MNTFVDATNAYAASIGRNVHHRGWRLLTVNELWSFFSIVFFLGTISIRKRREFWDPSGSYYNKWVASAMDCGHFEDIIFCLHWVNTAELSDPELLNCMFDRGIFMNGTIRTNRFERKWNIPKSWFYKKKPTHVEDL
jgi:hypothetical protein